MREELGGRRGTPRLHPFWTELPRADHFTSLSLPLSPQIEAPGTHAQDRREGAPWLGHTTCARAPPSFVHTGRPQREGFWTVLSDKPSSGPPATPPSLVSRGLVKRTEQAWRGHRTISRVRPTLTGEGEGRAG